MIMKHATSRTFLDHYLPRNVDTDMQNIMNGREPNTPLMHAIRRISRWIDKRRPRNVSPQERASLISTLNIWKPCGDGRTRLEYADGILVHRM